MSAESPFAQSSAISCFAAPPQPPLLPPGSELPLRLRGAGPGGATADLGTSTVLRFEEEAASFTFEGVEAEPVPSLLRGFSAPVKLTVQGQTDEQLEFLLAHDTDPFNRWGVGVCVY